MAGGTLSDASQRQDGAPTSRQQPSSGISSSVVPREQDRSRAAPPPPQMSAPLHPTRSHVGSHGDRLQALVRAAHADRAPSLGSASSSSSSTRSTSGSPAPLAAAGTNATTPMLSRREVQIGSTSVMSMNADFSTMPVNTFMSPNISGASSASSLTSARAHNSASHVLALDGTSVGRALAQHSDVSGSPPSRDNMPAMNPTSSNSTSSPSSSNKGRADNAAFLGRTVVLRGGSLSGANRGRPMAAASPAAHHSLEQSSSSPTLGATQNSRALRLKQEGRPGENIVSRSAPSAVLPTRSSPEEGRTIDFGQPIEDSILDDLPLLRLVGVGTSNSSLCFCARLY